MNRWLRCSDLGNEAGLFVRPRSGRKAAPATDSGRRNKVHPPRPDDRPATVEPQTGQVRRLGQRSGQAQLGCHCGEPTVVSPQQGPRRNPRRCEQVRVHEADTATEKGLALDERHQLLVADAPQGRQSSEVFKHFTAPGNRAQCKFAETSG